MQIQNKKYRYEAAEEKDGEKISELLEKTAFEGDISLIYAKRPNAITSINYDADKSIAVVGRDISNEEIKGVGICQIYKTLVNGIEENTAYLGGLRVEKGAVLNIFNAYKIIETFVKENDVKYTYTTILTDNTKAQKMLTKKRKSMPYYIKISD